MRMRAFRITVLLLAIFGGYNITHHNVVAAPPPGQPHTDLFTYAGIPNFQAINPVNVKAQKSAHAVKYALVTRPGCTTGSIPEDIHAAEADLSAALQFNLSRDQNAPDLIMFIACGMEQSGKCGSVSTFCLPDGYPYNLNIYISDILSTYQPITRIAIILHELFHALASWNEQYCGGYETSGPCQGLPLFANTPGWVDIMNTGPNSRHLIGDTEKRRWCDTMYCPGTAVDPCLPIGPNQDLLFFYPCDGAQGQFVAQNLWAYDLATKIWFNPRHEAEWGECQVQPTYSNCWNIKRSEWVFKNATPYPFDPDFGFLVPPI